MTNEENQPLQIEMPDGIGIRIKSAREEKSFSQSDVHRITGISRMVISKYEAGQNKPGARELRLLCDALNVSPNYLIYGTEDTHTKSDSLTDIVMSLRNESAVIVSALLPVIASILGRDDTRRILELVESLIRAKSPKEYELIARLLNAAKANSGKRIDEVNWLIEGQLLVDALERSIQKVFDQNDKK